MATNCNCDSSAAAVREIATILANGIVRLQSRAALPTASADNAAAKNPGNSEANGLEVPRETVLSVSNRVNGFGEPERRPSN